jgi:hypothetical protein
MCFPIFRERKMSYDNRCLLNLDELSGTDNSTQAAMLPPDSSQISFTMPGSLFARSKSLEPTPEPDWERVRLVRFSALDAQPNPSEKQASKLSKREETPFGHLPVQDAQLQYNILEDSNNATQRRKPSEKPRVNNIRDDHSGEDEGLYLSDGVNNAFTVSDVHASSSLRRAAPQRRKEIPAESNHVVAYTEVDRTDTFPELLTAEQSVATEPLEGRVTQCPVSPGVHQRNMERIEVLEAEVRRLREEVSARLNSQVSHPFNTFYPSWRCVQL